MKVAFSFRAVSTGMIVIIFCSGKTFHGDE